MPATIYNPDGLVEHRATPKKAPKKTLATVLEEAIARDDVRAAVAVSFGLRADASIGEIVATAISNDLLLTTIDHAKKLAAEAPLVAWPALLATCAAFALFMAGQVPHIPTEPQARGFREFAHQTVAAGPRETAPINLKPTAAELRHRDAARRWWA